jgi:hypothetical protein
VLIAGGTGGPNNYFSSAELYDVGLGYSNSWQPQITTFTSPLNLGGSLVITGSQFRGVSESSSGNNQDSASDYPLVQLRSMENGQVTFLLTTNWSANMLVSVPVTNFPVGWALVTVFANGIPGASSILRIAPTPTVIVLTNVAKLAGGSFRFAFSNTPGAVFSVLATTNLSLPITNWTALGGVMEITPGQFQFTDPQATNGPKRFYRAFSP